MWLSRLFTIHIYRFSRGDKIGKTLSTMFPPLELSHSTLLVGNVVLPAFTPVATSCIHDRVLFSSDNPSTFLRFAQCSVFLSVLCGESPFRTNSTTESHRGCREEFGCGRRNRTFIFEFKARRVAVYTIPQLRFQVSSYKFQIRFGLM
jgi:hypothetical protein